MVHRSDDFLLAWSSLSGAGETSGWRAIGVSNAGPVAIQAGRRFPGNHEALLVCFPNVSAPAAEKMLEGQGFSVECADPNDDGQTWLALTCKSSGSVELFAAMACDVAAALDAASDERVDENRMLHVFLGRVRAWQEFMRKGNTWLTADAEIGLFGELTMLSAIIDAGVDAAVALQAWVGPLDGVQDFELGTGAIEVKSTISAAGFTARIGSLEQLDDSVRQPLYVAAVRLRPLAKGQCLPDVIKFTRAKVLPYPGAVQMLAERLIAVGYFDNHAGRYARRFEAGSARLIEVTSAFPRLVGGTVPAGVARAIYDLDLDKVPGPNADLVEALKKLGAI